MSENADVHDITEATDQPSSMQDISRIFTEYEAKLSAAKQEFEAADAMLGERREEHSVAYRAAQDAAKQRIDALRAEEDSKLAALSKEQSEERTALVEQANGAIDAYKEVIREALATGVITKQALAMGGHSMPKGKRRS